jgi:tetratricopeptide (TPR) repeat protein
MADRYTYIPLVGLFIIAAWGIPDLLGEWRKKKGFLLLSGGAILAALTAVTFQQVSYWENSESLYRRTVSVVPHSALIEVNLGNTLLSKGRVKEAISHYENALKIRPQYGVALYSLGQAWQRDGDMEKAAAYYQQALEIPRDREKGFHPIDLSKAVNAHIQLGNRALRQKDADLAEEHFAFVMQYTTQYNASIYRELARAFEEQGKMGKATAYRKKAEE